MRQKFETEQPIVRQCRKSFHHQITEIRKWWTEKIIFKWYCYCHLPLPLPFNVHLLKFSDIAWWQIKYKRKERKSAQNINSPFIERKRRKPEDIKMLPLSNLNEAYDFNVNCDRLVKVMGYDSFSLLHIVPKIVNI